MERSRHGSNATDYSTIHAMGRGHSGKGQRWYGGLFTWRSWAHLRRRPPTYGARSTQNGLSHQFRQKRRSLAHDCLAVVWRLGVFFEAKVSERPTGLGDSKV